MISGKSKLWRWEGRRGCRFRRRLAASPDYQRWECFHIRCCRDLCSNVSFKPRRKIIQRCSHLTLGLKDNVLWALELLMTRGNSKTGSRRFALLGLSLFVLRLSGFRRYFPRFLVVWGCNLVSGKRSVRNLSFPKCTKESPKAPNSR